MKKVAKDLLARLEELLVLNWRQKAAARCDSSSRSRTRWTRGCPAPTRPTYQQKCAAVFEPVYESYPERGSGIHADVA